MAHLGRTTVKAGAHNEREWIFGSVRYGDLDLELADIANFGNIGAVGGVVGIVEVVLHEAAFRATVDRLDKLGQNQLSSYSVTADRSQGLTFILIGEPGMKQDDSVGQIPDVDVDGTVPPWSVGITHGELQPWASVSTFTLLQHLLIPVPCLCDEVLQRGPVHHVPGRNGRITVINCLVGKGDQMGSAQVEPRHQHLWCPESSGTEIDGGVAGVTANGKRSTFPGCGSGQSHCKIGPVTSLNSQAFQDGLINRGLEPSARQAHFLTVAVYPAVGRKLHDVGGAGTQRPSFLPHDASKVNGVGSQRLLPRGQRELPQALGAAVHLLRCYAEGLPRIAGRRAHNIRLRHGRVPIGKETGHHEQTSRQQNPGSPG